MDTSLPLSTRMAPAICPEFCTILQLMSVAVVFSNDSTPTCAHGQGALLYDAGIGASSNMHIIHHLGRSGAVAVV